MSGYFVTALPTFADASVAIKIIHTYVAPIIQTLAVVGSLICTFLLIVSGFHYMTSSGNPEKLEHAKRIIKNAIVGLLIVISAGTITTILSHAYVSAAHTTTQQLPMLSALKTQPVSNGLVDILIKAITGLLNNIIQSAAEPFLKALTFFTTATPLMISNASVFNFWLVTVGMTDALFVLAIVLVGLHVMSFSVFGLDEIDIKQLLPRIALVFVLINSSLFLIDGIISFSNVMIHAVTASFGSVTVWDVLTKIVDQSAGLGLVTLFIMVVFLILAVILLVYYVGRLVTLYIGAVLAPFVLLLWIIPSFKDFSESACKAYTSTIFVLFIHVIILQLAASLFSGLEINSATQAPDTLMALIVGLATLVALLKTQGVMMQLSYASLGPKAARRLGRQFVDGISYFAESGRDMAMQLGLPGTSKFHNTYYGATASTKMFIAPGTPKVQQPSPNAIDSTGVATIPNAKKTPGATTTSKNKDKA